MSAGKLPAPTVTMILPQRESFSPASAGAVAMVVQRLAGGSSRYRGLVVGPPTDGPTYRGIAFLPARIPRFLPLSVTQRYAIGLAKTLAPLPPGVIEVHNKPDVAMWLARWFRSRPVVLFLHNDPRQMRGARSARARQALVRRLARVVTVSEFLRGALLQGVPCVPPEWAPMVLHNALNLAALPPLLRPDDREKLILFVGRIVADKAADVFVSACAQALPVLPGWRAEMIGSDGFSGDCDDTPFISKLRPLAVGAGVIMSGYQPHEAVMRAMARAAIVIVPSRWEEPFGMTALEAMACGCALMCSGRGGLAEVMGEAAVRIDPDRPEAVAQLLIALANDAGHRSALSEAGRRRAAEYFNASQAVAKVDAMRDEVLTRAGVGGPR